MYRRMKRANGVRIFSLQETTKDNPKIRPHGYNFNRREFHLRSLFVDLCREFDFPALGLGLLHQATNCVKHHLELPIAPIALLRHELVRQILVR